MGIYFGKSAELWFFGFSPCEQQFTVVYYMRFPFGEVAQLVEHHVRNVRVGGSNPLFSTIPKVRFVR